MRLRFMIAGLALMLYGWPVVAQAVAPAEADLAMPQASLQAELAWAPVLDWPQNGFLIERMLELQTGLKLAWSGDLPWYAALQVQYGSSALAGEVVSLERLGAGLGAGLWWTLLPGWQLGGGLAAGLQLLRYSAFDLLGWYGRVDAFMELRLNQCVSLGLVGSFGLWGAFQSADSQLYGLRLGISQSYHL